MKIRILPGGLNAYTQQGGSWNDADPDPASFQVEVAAMPIPGSYIVYDRDDKTFITLVDDVVLVHGACVYVFATTSREVN